MMEAITQVRGLLEVGGNVLGAIFGVTVVMWTLIIERYWFTYYVHPRAADELAIAWREMPEKSTWDAQVIRRMWISQSMMDLDQGLALIRALIAVCPLLGLLGTVTGMVEVYETMSIMGNSEPRLMADGVSQAMVTTMAGLVVALSGIFFSTRLEYRRVQEFERLNAALHIDEDLLAHHHRTRNQKARERAQAANERRRRRKHGAEAELELAGPGIGPAAAFAQRAENT